VSGPADQVGGFPVSASKTVFRGRIWDVVADTVELPTGPVRREYLRHPGAVAVMAVDDAARLLLQRQYRHPVRTWLWEPPAGILDVAGEPPADTARRELAEEADLTARDWRRLLSFNSTPGGTSEVIHVFLARGLEAVPVDQRFRREDEEADLEPAWVGVEAAVELVMAGALTSPTAVVGILAAARARTAPGGWDALPEA
jgi:ADP-ribose pyrophosphatase